jgi:hypothetical protein
MKLLFFILISLLFDSVAYGQRVQHKRDIRLPADVDLSLIEHVDIAGNGDILITDSSRRNVILFKKEDEAFRELNPEVCHPGYSFQPVKSHFVNDQIWVMNQQSSLFRFKKDGSCIGADSKRFSVPDHFTVTDSNSVAAIMPIGNDLQNPGLTLYNFGLEKISESISFQDRIVAPEMGFRYDGGGLLSHKGKIYFSMSSAPIIYIYSIKTGELEKVTAGSMFDLNMPNGEDLNGKARGNPVGIMRKIQDYVETNATTLNFSKLNDTSAVLYVQQAGQSHRAILYFDLETNSFLTEPHFTNTDSQEYFRAFGNSKAYNITFREREGVWVLQVFDVQTGSN